MSDALEGLAMGLIGGIGGGAGSMANIYKDERQNAARVDNETQLAEAKAQIELSKQKQIETFREQQRQGGKAADLKFEQENAGLINRMAADKARATDVGAPLRNEQTKAAKLSNEQTQLIVDKRTSFLNEKDPVKKRQLQEEYQSLTGKDPDKFAPVMGKDDAGNPVFMGMVDTKSGTFTSAADVPSGIQKPKKGGRGLDEIFGGGNAGSKEAPPLQEAPRTASLPQMDIQKVNQELIKMGEPKMGWSKEEYSRYNQLIAMQKSQMGKK